MRKLEQQSGGRLGVSILDTQDGRAFSYRGRERFPLCSTFKLLLCGAVLKKVDTHKLSLEHALDVHEEDLVEHSPELEKFVNRTTTVRAACQATLTLSDNAAANLLLPLVGDPRGLTRFVRTLGDAAKRSRGSLARHRAEMVLLGHGRRSIRAVRMGGRHPRGPPGRTPARGRLRARRGRLAGL